MTGEDLGECNAAAVRYLVGDVRGNAEVRRVLAPVMRNVRPALVAVL